MRKLILIMAALWITFSVHSQVIYVTTGGSGLKDGTSWSNALDGNTASLTGYTKLAEAIKAASSGSRFWIGGGTYFTCTDNDRDKSFELGQDVKLYGGFAGTENDTLERNISLHQTIFSGDIGNHKDSTDNTRIILKTVSGAWTKYSFIDGIDFIQANNDLDYAQGGGVKNTGYLSLRNCSFRNNNNFGTSDNFNNEGGGVFNSNRLFLEKCTFINNNSSMGGGVCNTGYAYIRSTKLFGNTAIWGGAIQTRADLTLVNSLIVNNSASWGGGICAHFCFGGGVVNVFNSTIANNKEWNILGWHSNLKIYNPLCFEIQLK